MSGLLHRIESESGYHGDCFEVALHRARRMPAGQNPTLVHALPIGTGPANRGRRFWHAWVEVQPRRGGPWMVHDFSNGRRIIAPADRAHAAGQLDPDLVWRYTLAEIDAMVAEHDTFGPWVPGWESMGL